MSAFQTTSPWLPGLHGQPGPPNQPEILSTHLDATERQRPRRGPLEVHHHNAAVATPAAAAATPAASQLREDWKLTGPLEAVRVHPGGRVQLHRASGFDVQLAGLRNSAAAAAAAEAAGVRAEAAADGDSDQLRAFAVRPVPAGFGRRLADHREPGLPQRLQPEKRSATCPRFYLDLKKSNRHICRTEDWLKGKS